MAGIQIQPGGEDAEARWLRSSVVNGCPSMVNGMRRRIAAMFEELVEWSLLSR